MDGQNGMTPQARRRVWVKQRKRKLRLVRLSVMALGAALAVVGLLLLILPTLRVKAITVTGNSVTSTAEILAASGVQVGDELFKLTQGEIADNIQSQFPTLGVRVKRGLSEITIEITERGSAYISYSGHWFLLNEDLTVVSMSDDENAFRDYPRMMLPSVARLSVGKAVQFAENGIDRSYVSELLSLLKAEGMMSHVTYIDVREKFHVSYVLEGQIRVILGSLSEADLKLELTEEILGARFDNDSPYVIVDVSDLKRTIFRAMQSADQLLTY